MKIWKRGLAFCMAVLLVVGMLPLISLAGYSYSENTYIETDKAPSGKVGKRMSITFKVRNPYEDTKLENVKVGFAWPDDDEYSSEDSEGNRIEYGGYPFEIAESMFEERKSLGTISYKGSRSVTLSAQVRRDLSDGYYSVPIEITYDGGSTVEEVNIWISMAGDSSTTEESTEENNIDYGFTLGEGQETPYGLYGDTLNFGVHVRNTGIKKAYDVHLNLVLTDATDTSKFPLDISQPNYEHVIGDMDPSELRALPFSMGVRENAKTGYYNLKYKITYREEPNGNFAEAIEKDFYIRIKGEDDEETTKEFNKNTSKVARIVVDSYETIPREIIAGEEFELVVRMKNASSDIPASNLLFTMESEKVSDSAIFTTETGSSSVAVNTLSPGTVTEFRYKLISKAGVEQRSYYVKIGQQYDSPEYTNAEGTVTIDIPLKQIARLNTGTIEVMPASINVGSETNIMFGINNTGKVDLYNVMVAFEADSVQTVDTYVGNIKPGATGNVDTMLTGIARTEDSGKIKIIITYEDENGELQPAIEKETTLFVNPVMEEDLGDMEAGSMEVMEPEPTFFDKYKIPICAGTAAVIVIIIIAVALRIKKKKKAAMEEGMDDEIS